MPSFSQHSRRELETCHEDLILILEESIKWYDFRVIEGHRPKERQNRLFREGKSQLQWPESNHNEEPSMAADIVPWPIDWEDRERFFYMAGVVITCGEWLFREEEISHEVRWGGDWDSDRRFDDQQFDDLPHFELVKP